MNPPDLLHFAGDWASYEQALYAVFLGELAQGGVEFDGLPVTCRRNPEANGRWAAFWHLIQEGHIEEERLPDIRRCERLRWVRWTIEHGRGHEAIDVWQNTRGREENTLLWYNEEYLVVLAERRQGSGWLLKTAYVTDRSNRKRQLARERDDWSRAQKS